ncbi:ATP-binding cassette sub-family C member 4 [Phytophthora ramorum]|uniref:ATP-binding cassette sub-family C member 4 n=1 Tax=Phytophthora ramorum TaxID=164328 RepID=UPI0030AB7F80|nr:ATP-binding cassette sub-family C member 4 [Phytophthora ramorum]
MMRPAEHERLANWSLDWVNLRAAVLIIGHFPRRLVGRKSRSMTSQSHDPKQPELDAVSATFHALQSPREGSNSPTVPQNETLKEDKTSPLDSANILSIATIWWLQPLLARGYKSPLTEDSVWELPKKDHSRRLQGRFDASWTKQDHNLQRKKDKRPDVNVALWEATKDKIAVAMGLYLVSATLTLVQPFLIKAILQNLEGQDNMFGISSGYGLAVLLGCVAFCGATAINSAQFLTARAGCNARMVVINSVFQKILRLSATARRTMNSGEVVTLAGVDSERVMEAYTIGLWCIISPIILVAVCVLIGTQMGAYVGLVVAATSVAIMYAAFTTSKQIGVYRRRISKISANRVKLTNEVLLGIRVIKFYAWEDSINETIRAIRDQEVALMRRYNYLRLTNAVLMFLAPTILNMVCFLVYILLGNTLDVATAFVILALTNACKMAFSIFANASVAVSEAVTSTGRLSDFLVAGEVALFFCDWFLSQWSKGAIDLSQKNSMAVYVGIVVASLLLTFIRFSRDLDQVDNPLPYFSLWMMLYIFQMASAFIVCAAADPYVLILYIPVGYAFWFAIKLYQSSARELKRLDSISRSPFLNLVSETISGIETVRSYKMVEHFSSHCEELLNSNAKFFLLFQSASRWFAMRTDWLVSVIIAAVAVLAIATKSSLGAAVAGLGLTYAAQLTSSFQRMTTLTTQVENIMTCFERIAHYGSLNEEGYQREATSKDAIPPAWPQTVVMLPDVKPGEQDTATSANYHEVKTPRASSALPFPDESRRNPLDTANLLSIATIWWLQPMLIRGYKSSLDEDRVWDLPEVDKARPLQQRFDAAYVGEAKKNSAKAEKKGAAAKRPNVNFALWQATKDTYVTALGCYLVNSVLVLIQPFLIKAILQNMEGQDNMFGISSGYGLAVLLGCVAFCAATAINSGQFLTARAGCNARMVVINSAYQKILRLSATARRTMNNGEVVTIAGVDSERVMEAYRLGLWCIMSPLILIAVCILVGTQMGAYVGLAVAVVSAAILWGAFTSSRNIGVYRRRISKIGANRVKLTNEVLLGIRVIKFYAWEHSISDIIHAIRDQEVALMRVYNNYRLANAILMFLGPTVLNLVCFVVYVLQGHTPDVSTTFVILALTNCCKMPFSIFANSSVAVAEAITSTRRLSDFLMSGEIDEYPPPALSPSDTPTISIDNADFQWEEDAPVPTLSSINLTLNPGTLTVVVGSVGSGKSSLVNALLGEMQEVRGTRLVRGSIAYASQQAWIQNQTVRDNILFGEPYDVDHYQCVVKACQLLPDFEMLELGDQTEIGERGINLSGGQKARVSVARAMYRARKFDFVVLDDPLSALDVHVANAVFSEGLAGLAQGKTRLLVLNSHYHLLQYADRVLVMADGQIVGDGTLLELEREFPFLVTPNIENDNDGDSKGVDEDAHALERKSSLAVVSSKADADGNGNLETRGKLIVAEDRLVGAVKMKTYIDYLASSGWNGYFLASVVFTLFAVAQVALFFCDWFLSQWSKGSFDLASKSSLAIYAGLVVGSAILVFIRCTYFMRVCMVCSGMLHSKYLLKVLLAPVTTFFDVTPVGRILNRFSRDLDQVDNPLPYWALWMLLMMFQMASAFIVCAAADPYVLIIYAPVGLAFVFAIKVYQASARELKRFDSITRSPFLNLVSETLSGIETIRSYKMTEKFSALCEQLLDQNSKYYLLYQTSSRWFAMRTDWLVSVIIAAVAILAIATKSTLGASVAGLGLTYAAQLTSSFQRMTTLTTQVEQIMTCFERIAHYGSLDEEGYQREATSKDAIPPAWPQTGNIHFENVSMRYREDLPLASRRRVETCPC